MRLELPDHAVDRFIQRVRPDLDHTAARLMLAARLHEAQPLREKTRHGQKRWRLSDPDCILVTRPAVWPADAREHIVVTILPAVDLTPCVEAEVMAEVLQAAAADAQAVTAVKATSPERARQRGRYISVLNGELSLLREQEKTARLVLLEQITAGHEAARIERRRLHVEQMKIAAERKIALSKLASRENEDCLKHNLKIAIRGLMTGNAEEAKGLIDPRLLDPKFWDVNTTKGDV